MTSHSNRTVLAVGKTCDLGTRMNCGTVATWTVVDCVIEVTAATLLPSLAAVVIATQL